MQYDIDGGNITVIVGEEARIDVPTALNYIKSGQAEIGETVDAGIDAFDLNAANKTTAYDNNASAKLAAYNDNATDKTNAFDLNASNKTGDFNDNYTLKKAAVDASADAAAASATLAEQWAIKMDGKVADEDYSAKYYADLASQAAGATGANIDLSNLSPTGEAKFDAKQDVIDADHKLSYDYLSDAPDLSAYVTTNTAQTITGAKTFSNDFSVLGNSIKISSTGTNCNYPLSFQLPSFTKGDAPASNVIAGIDFYGSARTNFTDRLSNIDFMVDTSKNSSIAIRPYDCSSSASTDAASLSIHYDANGNTYALCPAPSLASNASNYSKQIVNISYLNGASSGVVHLTGNETITGNKTFSGEVFYNRNDNQFRIISMTGNYGMIFRFDNSDNLYIFPTAQNDAYGSWDSTSKGLVIEASTGDVRAKGENGKGLVITDLGKTKSSNGYFKFSNGLIIAWGDFTYASGSGSVSVTLPTSMSSGSSYNVAVSFEGSRAHTGAVSSQTSTSFTFKSDSFESTGTANYIAIGY